MKQQYFYHQKGGWVRAKPRFLFSDQDEYAIAQNLGPMIGLSVTPETLRIRGQAFKYSVRVSWEGRVHCRNIDLEDGTRVDVKFSSRVEAGKGDSITPPFVCRVDYGESS